jgi:hypothetical protein
VAFAATHRDCSVENCSVLIPKGLQADSTSEGLLECSSVGWFEVIVEEVWDEFLIVRWKI